MRKVLMLVEAEWYGNSHPELCPLPVGMKVLPIGVNTAMSGKSKDMCEEWLKAAAMQVAKSRGRVF